MYSIDTLFIYARLSNCKFTFNTYICIYYYKMYRGLSPNVCYKRTF